MRLYPLNAMQEDMLQIADPETLETELYGLYLLTNT